MIKNPKYTVIVSLDHDQRKNIYNQIIYFPSRFTICLHELVFCERTIGYMALAPIRVSLQISIYPNKMVVAPKEM